MGQQIKGERVDAAVRQRLLAAALDSFTRKGYAATSVREVVAAAGVTKPVLYYYFGSKEGIYLELMNDTYALFAKRLDLLAACQGSVRERLIAFCTGCFDGFVEHVQVVRLIYSIYFGPSQGAPPFPYEEPFDRMLAILAGFVRDGIAAGELVAVDDRGRSHRRHRTQIGEHAQQHRARVATRGAEVEAGNRGRVRRAAVEAAQAEARRGIGEQVERDSADDGVHARERRVGRDSHARSP